MYEFEVSAKHRRAEDLPQEIANAFRANDVFFDFQSIHTWEEHCTECAYPDCYKTCDLFVPRKDGNCRRFEDGAVRIDGLTSGGGPVVEITFKRWANMYSTGSSKLVPRKVAARAELLTRRVLDFFRSVPDDNIIVHGWPAPTARIAKLLRKFTHSWLTRKNTGPPSPEKFVLVIYVPSAEGFDVTLHIAPENAQGRRPFQKRLVLAHGYHQIDIPIDEVIGIVGDVDRHHVSLIANTEGASSDKAYLGFIGFARSRAQTVTAAAKSVKVMVWDLDHTLWDGILVEDGPENIRLKPDVVNVIKTLDSRGIVNSIATKNDPEPALAALETFGIAEFFVFPQFSWNPKSGMLQEIIRDFNVGANSMAFIDDQPFERTEVETMIPEVRTYDAARYREILTLPEFNPEVSSESASRRQQYINEGSRRTLAAAYDASDYEAFLNDCDLQMTILRGGGQNIDRIYELTQRTNQMNFSGTRYKREDIVAFLENDGFDIYALQCSDKFGQYGTVGFCLVQLPDAPDKHPRVIDLAFSCRVQAKRTEHSFLTWLAHTYHSEGATQLEVRYVPTPRNAATAAVFGDMDFETVAAESTQTSKIVSISLKPPPARTYPWAIDCQDRRAVA